MQWLDKVLFCVNDTCSLEFYDGCVETMYQTNQINVSEYDSRKKWIKDQEAKKTKELLERVK